MKPITVRRRYWGAVAALVAIVLCTVVVWQFAYRQFVRETAANAVSALEFHVAGLSSYLDKYRIVPALLAQRSELVAHFERNDVEGARDLAAASAAMTGSARVALWRNDRTLLASSASEATGTGADVALARTFEAALQGRLGRALLREVEPATSDEEAAPAPSYLFTAPVFGPPAREPGRPIHEVVGLVVVAASLGPIQQAWALRRDPLLALSQDSRIVLTNRPEWHSVELGEAMHQSSKGLRGGGEIAVDGFPATPADSAVHLVRLAAGRAQLREFVHVSRALPLMDGTLHVVAETAGARVRANNVALSTALALTVLTVAVAFALLRRAALVERVQREQLQAQELEERVRARTSELTTANRRLAREVRVREAAESGLRQAQAELVQAERLATLGQMSAAIGHEFNQPLAAIRSYADSAEQLIAAHRVDDAIENLHRIGQLVDRMGEMSTHLKLFSRQAAGDVTVVPLSQAIDGALLLLGGTLRRHDVRVVVNRPAEPVLVHAGVVRLEQVVVNLLTNAIDALEGRPEPTIWLEVRADAGDAELTVADNGPGIAAENIERIATPFFTTKPAGRGLGLGLAIVYKIVHDFGGTLVADNRPEGGARFRVRFPLAAAPA